MKRDNTLGTRRRSAFRSALMSTSKPAVLALEDGSVYRGFAFGADATPVATVVAETAAWGRSFDRAVRTPVPA